MLTDAPPASALRPGTLSFRCNVCGAEASALARELARETPSCGGCGSTLRMRGIVRMLSEELFGRSLALPDFPVHPEIKGLGMSDWDGYAIPILHKLGYKNTFYHQEPRLNILDPDPALFGTLDYLISTDVFEHVGPPIQLAFDNARRLLRRTGVFLFTVPYSLEEDTTEHYPELFRYEVVERDGKHVLRNVTKDGREQVFENPVFHGGPGQTVELRVFSEKALRRHFKDAGFGAPRVWKEPDFEHGLYWPYDYSLPISVRPA